MFHFEQIIFALQGCIYQKSLRKEFRYIMGNYRYFRKSPAYDLVFHAVRFYFP